MSNNERLRNLCAQSESYSGYEREQAVKQLGDLGNPLALPYLLVRANDWVDQVQDAALLAIRQLMRTSAVPLFIRCLPEIARLQTFTRRNHQRLVNDLERFIAAAEHYDYLVAGLDSDDAIAWRCADLLCRYHLIHDPHEIQQLMAGATDRSKTHFARMVHQFKQPADVLTFSNTLLAERNMLIRREGMLALARHTTDTRSLMPYLYDRHRAIRRLAIQAIGREQAITEYQQHLAAHLSGRKHYQATLKYAVVELGTLDASMAASETVALLSAAFNYRKFAANTALRIRILRALVSIQQLDAATLLATVRQDSNSRLRHEALMLSTQLKLLDSADQVLHLIEEGQHFQAFSIYPYLNKWEQLIVLAEVAALPSRLQLVGMASLTANVQQWNVHFNRNYISPSANQIRRLNVVATSLLAVCDDTAGKEISLALKPYEITVD